MHVIRDDKKLVLACSVYTACKSPNPRKQTHTEAEYRIFTPFFSYLSLSTPLFDSLHANGPGNEKDRERVCLKAAAAAQTSLFPHLHLLKRG